MSYGELKIDTITFTSAGVDASVSVSGLVQNPTFTGNLTTTGTISGDTIKGNTISGVTITGETGEFAGTITASGFIPNGTGVLTNGLYSPDTNRVALSTNSTNHFTLTESGVFLFATGVVATGVVDRGGTTQYTPKTQLAGQGSNRDTALSLLHYSSAGFSPTIVLGTSNSNTFGEYTDTVSGRVYGDILFETANETNDSFRPGVLIRGFADHTPGAGLNGVPGALAFHTGPAGQVGTIERMRIASSGNVGIGNFSNSFPDALLELQGSAAVVGTPELFISNIGAVTSGNTSSTITFRGGATGSQTNIARFTVIADGNDENGGHLAFETTASGGSLTEQLRIEGGGNVGVGTTSASTKLHVRESSSSGKTTVLTLEAAGTAADDGPAIDFIPNGSATASASIVGARPDAAGTDGYLAFYTNDATNNLERVRIDSSGRLLVGVTTGKTVGSPTQSLLQAESTNPASFSRQSDDTAGPIISFAKSRGTPTTAVQDDDSIAALRFAGSDGTDMEPRCAEIGVRVDGTVASNSVPGELYFSTTAATDSSPTQHLLIRSSGKFQFNSSAELGTVSSTGTLKIYGGATNQGGQIDLTGGSTEDGIIKFRTGTGAGEKDEKARIDSVGRLLVGTNSAVETSSNTLLQVVQSNGGYFIAARNDTAVTDGNLIGGMRFYGNDSDGNYDECARINCVADGTHGDTSKPSRLQFFTTETGLDSPTERIRIDSEGRVRHIPFGLTAPSAGEYQTPYFLGVSGVPALDSDAGAESSGFLRMMDLGPTDGEFIGVDIRNRNSGDMRICNEDSSTSNRANFVVGIDTDINAIEQVLKISYLAAFYATGIYDHTTAGAANVNVVSGGQVRRSTSSAKYKTDIETIEDSYADALLNCRPVWYRSTCTGDNPDWSYWGLIAEEVADIDPRLVHWGDEKIEYTDRLDEDGNVLYEEDGVTPQKIRVKTKTDELHPEGVAYDRFVPHLLNLIKRQKEQIEAMEARLAALEAS